jgi:hypothetical protein
MASKTAQRVFLWLAITTLVALAGLAVVGAFLGFVRARELFTSFPMRIGWAAFGALLIASFGAFLALRRKFGLAAMHVGVIMILVGSMLGSPEAHDLWNPTEAGRIHRGLVVAEAEMTRTHTTVYDEELIAQIGEFPFAMAATDYRKTYHLPLDGSWNVAFELHVDGATYQMPFDLTSREPQPVPTTDLSFEVRSVQPAVYARNDEGDIKQAEPFSVQLVCTREGVTYEMPPITTQDRPAAFGWSLQPLYSDAGSWVIAGSPLLVLSPPSLGLKQHRAELTIQDITGETHTYYVAPNEPFWHGGYVFYFREFNPQTRFVLLEVVADTGWSLTWAGFMVLLAGSVWYGWSGVWRRGRAS